ncbi:hypothetical protein M9458_025240, partial [Cirrhinus mrigala]
MDPLEILHHRRIHVLVSSSHVDQASPPAQSPLCMDEVLRHLCQQSSVTSPAPPAAFHLLGNGNTSITSPLPITLLTVNPRLALPRKYDAALGLCRGFLLQCSLYIAQQPQAFNNEEAKVAFIVSLLSGKVLEWAPAVWDHNAAARSSLELFKHHCGGSLDVYSTGQGHRGGLCAIAPHPLCSEGPLKTIYRLGLSHSLQAELASRDAQLGAGLVRSKGSPVPFSFKLDNYIKRIFNHFSQTHTNPLILGFPWLVLHNPAISWKEKDILQWSPSCFHTCLKVFSPALCHSTRTFKSPMKPPPNVPHEYQDWHHIFYKATKLPPHHPQDCAIDLLPGTHPPKSCIYPLSIPETKAIEDYVEKNLKLGFIRPSTSLAASGFFF